MIKIELIGAENRIIEAESEQKTLLSILQEQQIYLDAPCAGNGTCGGCRVKFLEGAGALTEKEKELLSIEEQEQGIRLACATKIEKDCRIQLLGLPEQILAVADISESAAEQQKKNGKSAECAEYGIAIDIGTTTLAMALVALESRNVCEVITAVNHQRAYGADVMSRIQAANDGKAKLLQQCIQDDLNGMMTELLKKAELTEACVKKIVIAGNTTMCHLLLGYSCKNLGTAPFIPEDITLQELGFEEVFGNGRMDAVVTILPGISAFVGADIVAGMYACDMHKSSEMTLLLDIGTNGEMVIGNKNGFLATSTAAGPVFEGAGISCGVPGVQGAVSHFWLEKSGECRLETIGNEKPIGICGTGIIDVVSEFVRHNIIDENGTFSDIWFESGYPVYEPNLCITQADIREVQMGKAAIRVGIENLQKEQVPRKIYLAGGFGYYLNAENAVKMGMFPEEFLDKKMISVGNGSLKGAVKYLLEPDAKEACVWISTHVKEQNLALTDTFNELYLSYMNF